MADKKNFTSNASHEKAPSKPKMPQGMNLTIIGCIAGLVIGFIFGKFIFCGPNQNVTNLNKTTVTESELNQIIGSYTYDGKNYTISIKDAIDHLGNTTNSEGTYNMPSTDSIVALARQNILKNEAEKSNITVSDDEINTYIKDTFNVESVDELTQFGYKAEQIKDMVTTNIIQEKLQKQVMGEEVYKQPDYPDPAKEGEENNKTEAYAEYIKKLVGDKYKDNDWTEAGTEYKDAIAASDGGEFDGKTANYKAAMAVFQTAYREYDELQGAQTQKWLDYTNDIFKGCTITVATLDQ